MVANVRIDPADHLGLAKFVCNRFARVRGGHGDDYLGMAYVALARACETFRPGKGYAVSTHLVHAMEMQLRTQTRSLDRETRHVVRVVDGKLQHAQLRCSRPMSEMGEYRVSGFAAPEASEISDATRLLAECVQLAADRLPMGARVLRLKSQGVRPKDIAKTLGVSHHEVMRIVRRIRRDAEGVMRAAMGRREPIQAATDAHGARRAKSRRVARGGKRRACEQEPAGALRAVCVRPPGVQDVVG